MSLGASIKAIAKAATGLACSIDGVHSLEVRNWSGGREVIFDLATDELVVAFIEALGATRENVISVCGTKTWIEGRARVGKNSIRISGPHTEIAKVKPRGDVDTSAVAAAVACAEQAVQP